MQSLLVKLLINLALGLLTSKAAVEVFLNLAEKLAKSTDFTAFDDKAVEYLKGLLK